MKIKIQFVTDRDNQSITEDIICLERQELSAETLGLILMEAKKITAEIQKKMVYHQIKDFVSQNRFCSCCGTARSIKGYHPLVYRTLFGRLVLKSPRVLTCQCQPQSQPHYSFSPLCSVLTTHISPELSYLEAKWASLMSYGMSAKLLEEVLPLEAHPASIFTNLQKVSTRLEAELEEEKLIFIEGCQRDWDQLPRPGTPLTISLDGGYVHAREGNNRKAGWFEVIVGKSMQEKQKPKRFGYVTDYETKPKRKLYAMLHNQGLQLNQDITFITDGGDTVRDLPLFLSPRSDHILDWFHITMRITVIKQMAKSVMGGDLPNFEKRLDRIKWFLWHGNVFKALDILESLDFELDTEVFAEGKDAKKHKKYKLYQSVDEFYKYIEANSTFIPNYGERYRYGEAVSSAVAESTVNEMVSRRMAKKQQMRWTKEGAHALLQVRAQTLNDELSDSFKRWYPKMVQSNAISLPLAA
ncbi:ISKra4 family transposase [Candidatus Finniella inopinata]|uniref:ISKra4 family transposase n=1 Tax=Candidatus Finniella inopinata TaxID=1696036 RepID=A0A4Q7DEX5_9PROT|nr:ISKra4 family transposase [Candidatus Finniella inopinata]RZI45233.1 ISKra4 family transposase [Candidatus Finniella inopinata]